MAQFLNTPVNYADNQVNPGSQSNISDFDQDYELDSEKKRVISHEMYDTKNPIVTGKIMSNSEVVASRTIERLISNVANIMHEKYINSKLDGHTIESTYDLVEMLFCTEFINYDHNKFVDTADEEPGVITIDNWGRAKIPSKKIHKIEAKNEFTDHAESMLSEDRKALQKAKEIGKKIIKDAKSENMPAPLDLQEPVEMNKTEDDLRQVKERERKRQEDEKNEEAKKRKAENQSKFKQGNADLKKKPFTYDYNGVPIIINAAKVDKFPPSAQPVQSAVQDPEVEISKDKKKKASAKDVAAVKPKPKKTPDTEQEFVKKYGLGVPTYDILEPAAGVTYFEGGKTKQSNKLKNNMTAMTAGSLISTLGNQRLTKTEYLHLTKGGNLSRTNVADKDASILGAAKTNIDGKKLLDPNATKDHWASKTGNAKEINANTTGALRMMNNYKNPGDGINVEPAKLKELINATYEIEQDMLMASKQMPATTTNKFNTDDSLKRSPIDTFNLELLNSKDWGKSTFAGTVNSLPKLPAHARFDASAKKQKSIRYRIPNAPTTNKNYEEMLYETLKSQQIS